MLELIQLISETKYIVTAANVLLSTRCAFAASYAAFKLSIIVEGATGKEYKFIIKMTTASHIF